MRIFDHIILGDGPVSRIVQSSVTSGGENCLVLDCGSGLNLLLENLQIQSNVNYVAKKMAPSLNDAGSDFMWAGGLQGWPEEDWLSNRTGGLPDLELRDQYNSATMHLKKLLGVYNFEFKRDMPIFSTNILRRVLFPNLRKIYCKILADPSMSDLKQISEQNPLIEIVDTFIATKIVPHPDFVRVEGMCLNSNSRLYFDCKRLHLALGTVENTRILLNSKRELNLEKNSFLGRYLSDHLTFIWGTFTTQNLPRVIRHFSRPKTSDGNSIWPRVKFASRHDENESSSFAHLDDFRFDGRIPIFYRILRRLRKEHFYFTFAKSGYFNLNLFVEKKNEHSNFIEVKDSPNFGIPSAKIFFEIGQPELDALYALSSKMEAAIRLSFPDIIRVSDSKIDVLSRVEIQAGTHASGTYRMSVRHEDGVINQKSELWSDNRIRVLGAGAFPVASATHPTFTSMALALIGVHRD